MLQTTCSGRIILIRDHIDTHISIQQLDISFRYYFQLPRNMANYGSKNEDFGLSPIWKPTLPQNKIPMNIYREHVNQKFNQQLCSSQELHRWSVENLHDFWIDLHQYTAIIPPLPASITIAFDPKTPMEKVPEFFRGATVNYAENVVTGRDLNKTALIGVREGQDLSGEVWSWGSLRENIRKARSALLHLGVQEGDRVAAIISTSVWSVGLFLATASIGAIWTSIAPDLGEEVILPSFEILNEPYLTGPRDVCRDCNK
jgi:acetoacetyl-CoA synthetase